MALPFLLSRPIGNLQFFYSISGGVVGAIFVKPDLFFLCLLTQIHDFPPKIAENVYVQKCDMINYNVLRFPTARKVVCSARK